MRYADEFGFFELNPFPGCNQIVVSQHAFIYPNYRGKGLGQAQHFKRLKIARDLGYNFIICTVRIGNEAEMKILDNNGWKLFTTFYNRETENNVGIYGKSLAT